MNRLPLGIITAAVIVLWASPAYSLDIVKMRSGSVFEGEIVGESDEQIQFKTKMGVVGLSKEEIDSIERDVNLEAEFDRRFQKAKTADEFYKLGLWCEGYEHETQAHRCFEKAIEVTPDHKPSRIKLGHKEHKGKWFTEEEYNREVRGLVLHEGEWIPKADKEKLDAGFVKVDGKWVLRENAPAETHARRTNKKEPVHKKKSGKGWKPTPIFTMDEYKDTAADCSWDQRKTLTTEHYIIYTNIKDKYADKYKAMVERLYEKLCKVFNFKGQMPYKFKICIYNSKREFDRVTGKRGAGGFYTPAQKTLQVFHGWIPQLESGTQQVIQHEGTHQFQDMVMKNMMRSPIWLLEGLAVFFESSVFDEDCNIHIGAIPKKRLEDLQKAIKGGKNLTLSALISTPQARFSVFHYNHAWSLIYWLVYTSKNNQKVFNNYWVQCCEGGDSRNSSGFLKTIGIPIQDLEGHWKEWVLILAPEDMPEDVKEKSKKFSKKWNS